MEKHMNEVILRVEHVSKNFKGIQAVKDVSFSISKGEMVGLIGPNGAGKTTLFQTIAGFEDLSSGSVFFRDTDISKAGPHTINRMGIARTFQIVQPLLDFTVFDNVLVSALFGSNKKRSRKEAEMAVEEIIEFTELSGRKHDLASTLGTPGRKRLELARALATSPELLLLDEVMAGLTPSEVGEAVRLIRKINEKGITIIVVEHVMQAVMSLSKRILVLDYGELIAEGTPKEITSNEKVIEVYLGKDE